MDHADPVTLNESGRQRFIELENRLGTITSKVLTQRLRQLERDGLIRRRYHPEIPPRVEYEITDLGRSLSTVFAALGEWAAAHLPEVENARAAYQGPCLAKHASARVRAQPLIDAHFPIS
jgi:DNA-binding HxlR family transcriptional regulator